MSTEIIIDKENQTKTANCSGHVEPVVSGENNTSVNNSFVYFDAVFMRALKTKVGARRCRNQVVRIIKKTNFAN